MKKRPSYEAQKRKEFIRSHDFSVSIGTDDRVVVIVKPKEFMLTIKERMANSGTRYQ